MNSIAKVLGWGRRRTRVRIRKKLSVTGAERARRIVSRKR